MAWGRRYTKRSVFSNAHWCVPLAPLADERGCVPQDGQYVPQCVIDKLARYEDMEEALSFKWITPEQAQFFSGVMNRVHYDRFVKIMNAEMEGRLQIVEYANDEEHSV